MNEQSLGRANAFLATMASRTSVGDVSPMSPVEIGRELGFGPPLVAARAVRALIARRRIQPVEGGGYRLLDARPLEPGEPESLPRPKRTRKPKDAGRTPTSGAAEEASDEAPTYSELGREVVERLIDQGREVGTLRAGLKTAREEVRAAREAKDDAERRVETLALRIRELEHRAEMAESNLRTLLATARGAGRGDADAHVATNEMEAILGVLKGGEATG